MMKLSPLLEILLNEKKIKYDLSSVNGGFSDGVDINVTKKVGTIGISVNIYGGGNLNYLSFKTPQSIVEYQDALIAAMRVGDPVTSELSVELNAYKKAMKKAVSLAMVNVLRKFDEDAKAAINAAVSEVHASYGQTRSDEPVVKKPKPKQADQAPEQSAQPTQPQPKPQIQPPPPSKADGNAAPKQAPRRKV